MAIFESRDTCVYSPNVLFRCAEPDEEAQLGVTQGASYKYTGGIRQCEKADIALGPAYFYGDVELELSGEYNHDKLRRGHETAIPAQQRWAEGGV